MFDSLNPLQSRLSEISKLNTSGYIDRNKNISNARISDIINSSKPTKEELYNLTSIIDLDIIEHTYKQLFPNFTEKEIENLTMKFLSEQIQIKRKAKNFTWDDLEEKFGFKKQITQAQYC